MKQKDFHMYLIEQERTQVIGALIQLKNSFSLCDSVLAPLWEAQP